MKSAESPEDTSFNLGDAIRLDGQVALVTGAGRGVGRTCAVALARAGAVVIGISRTETELESLARAIHEEGGEARYIVCNITDRDSVRHMASTAGRVDILVNNAGLSKLGSFLEFDVTTLDELVSVNIRGTFMVSQAIASGMVERRAGGSIVNVTSVFAHVAAHGRSAYGMTKHAIEGLTKSMAIELAEYRIRVNSVAPVTLETKLSAPYLADPQFRAAAIARVPLGRVGRPADVAAAIIFLASPASAMITGTTLMVDGGYVAQ